MGIKKFQKGEGIQQNPSEEPPLKGVLIIWDQEKTDYFLRPEQFC